VWNGSAWNALGTGIGLGINNGVLSLVYDSESSSLYVGGDFTFAGGVSANYIAKWDGSVWSAFGTGTNSTVRSLSYDAANSSLYVGGYIVTAGDVSVNYIAKWNGTSWVSLGAGMNGSVNALAYDAGSSSLYAGGSFTTAGGVMVNRIAKWNGSSWSALGTGVNGFVLSLVCDSVNSFLYAGGNFTTAGGVTVNRIAKWNGSSWSALGTGVNNSVDTLVYDSISSSLYAGGSFTTAGGVTVNRIAKWNGSSWSALGTGVSNSVKVLAYDPGSFSLYAGGYFTSAGGVSANYVAKWNGSVWSPLDVGMNNPVFSLVYDSVSSSLYAGGYFTSAGGVSANYIAKWDGSAWSALGSGLNDVAKALVYDSGSSSLYVGGDFTLAGGVSANYIAKWDGSAWGNLGIGMNNSISALLYVSTVSSLYAGGVFSLAGGKVSAYFALCDVPTPPTVSIFSPSSGVTLGGTVTLIATDHDDIIGVTFYVNDVQVGVEDTVPPYATTWDTTSTSLGTKVLTAVAVSAGGSYATSTPVVVTVDNTPPSSVGAPTFGTSTIDSIVINKPLYLTLASFPLSQWQTRRNSSTNLSLVATTTTSVIDTGLTANTSYTYDVRFNDINANMSSYGISGTVYTLAPTPSNFRASLEQTAITLSVDSFPNATTGSSGYYFSRDGASSGWIQTNSWSDTGLICGNTYSYSVKHRNGDGVETPPAFLSTKTALSCGGAAIVYIPPVIGVVAPPVTPLPPLSYIQNPAAVFFPTSSLSSVATSSFPRPITSGTIGNDVVTLQKTLNALGYIVSITGAGSAGRESNYYGLKTQLAVQKFQCKEMKICKGTPITTGYGRFGNQTKAKILEVVKGK